MCDLQIYNFFTKKYYCQKNFKNNSKLSCLHRNNTLKQKNHTINNTVMNSCQENKHFEKQFFKIQSKLQSEF